MLEIEGMNDLKLLLMFINRIKEIKSLCNALKLCISFFKLKSNLDKVIEQGSELSLDLKIARFFDINLSIEKHLPQKEINDIRKILIEFEGSEDLLKFTKKVNKSEIDFMKEAVNDYDEGHISTQTIFDFTNFWSFMAEVKAKMVGDTMTAFLDQVKQTCKVDIYNNIAGDMKTCKVNFYGIQNLYLELTHKEEAKRKHIFKIVEHSLIKFTQEDGKFNVQVRCDKTTNNSADLLFKLSDMLELRDRAHLIVFTEQKKQGNKEDVNYKEDELDKFQSFCRLTDIIDQVTDNLNKLSNNGYPQTADLKVLDKDFGILDMDFKCIGGKFETVFGFKNELDDILKKWKESVIKSYVDFYDLTYLKGRDFWKVEKALNNPNEIKDSYKGIELLKYIGKDIQRVGLRIDRSPNQRLEDLGQTLQKFLPRNKKPLPVEKNHQFYIVETSEKAIIKGLMTLYLNCENRVPLSSQILICHQSTSLNELVAFAFRCYRSPDSQLFCLIQPERLSFALQDRFSMLFKSLPKEYGYRKFHLGFVTTDMLTHMVTSLRTKESTKIFKAGELLDSYVLQVTIKESNMTKNCMSVTSTTTGLGKTAFIKSYAAQRNLNYSKIPISGTINLEELGNRLSNVLLQQDVQHALCFAIGSIEEKDKSLLNEVLFSLVVLRSFHFGEDVVEVPDHAHILFEIDSSYFENVREEVEILSYLHNENIEVMNFEAIHYKLPKIQFVSHYLNGIANKSLGTTDLFEEDVEAKVLNKQQCLDALKPKFMHDRNEMYATYTQFNIYVNMLYSLFKSFSESGFFSYMTLAQEQNQHEKNNIFMKNEVIASMRLGLLDGLIIAADQFTSKSVEGVRNCQKESIMKQKEGAKKDVNEILNDAIVSWEKTRPFTVTFTSDNAPIFVYKSVNDIPEAVKQSYQHQVEALLALGRDKMDMKNILKEYSQYTQEDLFIELASLTNKLYNRNVCLKCFKKYATTSTDCDTCNIKLLENSKFPIGRDFVIKVAQESAKDYALTPDNFIKMLLIFMRAQQRMPIIIMGETGCGKTSLIRFLCSRVLDDVLEILSIHAGVGNDTIIDKMGEFVKSADQLLKKEKKLWIFFDEFNTTSSIGLIKEIMCERTLQGRALPDNMVFLGACNPRRLKTKQSIFDEDVGIRNNKIDVLNQGYSLLYTVYPLPETMIEFVWDYGHLDANTEKKYIEVMFTELDMEQRWRDMTVILVCTAQQQFRRFEDASSVSLRDVLRYKIILKWFYKVI